MGPCPYKRDWIDSIDTSKWKFRNPLDKNKSGLIKVGVFSGERGCATIPMLLSAYYRLRGLTVMSEENNLGEQLVVMDLAWVQPCRIPYLGNALFFYT